MNTLNTHDLALALEKMGYRQIDPARDPDRWVKPIGYDVLIAFPSKGIINHMFKGSGDGVFHCWDHVEIKMNDKDRCLEIQLAEYEANTNLVGSRTDACYAFLPRQREMEILCGL